MGYQVIEWISMERLTNAGISGSFLLKDLFLWRITLWGQEGEGIGVSPFGVHLTPLTSTGSSPFSPLCPQKIPVGFSGE